MVGPVSSGAARGREEQHASPASRLGLGHAGGPQNLPPARPAHLVATEGAPRCP